MKVCVIGDIHGTSKFIECYNNILANDNDCEKILVLGDHFDPYDEFSVDEMLEKYNEFIEISKKDNRIISILGNHDLSKYVIRDDETNRTSWSYSSRQKIREAISKNLPDSYLVYKIGNYLFSHAGVSQIWLNDIARFDDVDYVGKIMGNTKGWTEDELCDVAHYSYMDFSGYGNNVHQGCTWIRPQSLNESAVEGYNQVVGHTQVEEITSVQMKNRMDLWLVDDMRKSNYLVLNIEESE